MHSFIKYRKLLIALLEAVFVLISYYLAFHLTYNFELTPAAESLFLKTAPVLLAARLVLFYRFGLFSGWWRYVGMSDLVDIVVAALTSSTIVGLLLKFVFQLSGYPFAVIIIDLSLTIVLFGGARFAVRAYTEHAMRACAARKNTILVGAGRVGSAIVRELRDHPDLDYKPVGFVDDDPSKLGLKIHGVRVLGRTDELRALIEVQDAACLIIAIRAVQSALMQQIIDQCRDRKVELKIVPATSERWNGSTFSVLRNVSVEDVLGREPVRIERDNIRAQIDGKAIFITGAGGSIGSELARQIALFGPHKLILFDRSENDLFKIGTELSQSFPALSYVPVVGDILDVRTLRDVFAMYRPNFLFHAAAYKHVPMMELNCFQAVMNNIFGTYNIAMVARDYQVGHFVLISTDKAVNPTNVMGVTKRVAELIIIALRHQPTCFTAVRFGNVLNSNGSVLPLIQQQIAAGGPITITHPQATRYFMTIPEAAQLVLQASVMGQGGEIFLLDMGGPVRIVDLARNVVRLSGLTVDRDVQIVFTGLRPGEKVSEELRMRGESVKSTAHEKIWVLDGGKVDLVHIQTWLDEFAALVEARNAYGLVTKLKSVVPEYRPSPEVLAAGEADRYDRSWKYIFERPPLSEQARREAAA